MTLLEQIQANTETVKAGKTALAQAIENKGTPIVSATPTFNELVQGINDISTGVEIQGTTDVKCYATDSMPKGTLCSLTTPPDQSYKGILVKGCPITAKDRKFFSVFKFILLSLCS